MVVTPLVVIFNLTIFVLVFLFVKTIDKRKWLSVLVSLVLTPLVYFYVFYPILNIFSSYHHQKYFNSEVWIEKPSLRFEMTENILKSDTLMGKTKPEIEKLLGTYEWLTWNDTIKNHDENLWNYALGLKPGALNNKKECMTIVFKDDKVSDIETYNEEITFDAKE